MIFQLIILLNSTLVPKMFCAALINRVKINTNYLLGRPRGFVVSKFSSSLEYCSYAEVGVESTAILVS